MLLGEEAAGYIRVILLVPPTYLGTLRIFPVAHLNRPQAQPSAQPIRPEDEHASLP
jgi:hypothetical protein